MKTKIGILGTGRMAVRLARLFAESGNEVILGSRTPERAKRITQGLGLASIKPGTYEAAVRITVEEAFKKTLAIPVVLTVSEPPAGPPAELSPEPPAAPSEPSADNPPNQ